jgi:hypothetical protein
VKLCKPKFGVALAGAVFIALPVTAANATPATATGHAVPACSFPAAAVPRGAPSRRVVQPDEIVSKLRYWGLEGELTVTDSGITASLEDWEHVLHQLRHAELLTRSFGSPSHETLRYFILFSDERDARGFAADLPEGSDGTVTAPEDEGDQWSVEVTGPWDDPDRAEKVLEPIARRHHGEYDGPEET